MTGVPDGPERADRLLLVLARHGQTPSNVERLLDTRLPGPGLTDLGRSQAAALGAELAAAYPHTSAERVVAVYSSAATRARETAALVADALGLLPAVVDGLHEVQVGTLEGRNDDAAVERFRETVDRWRAGDVDLAFEEGESAADLVARYRRAIADIRRRHGGGGTVVVVGHGAAIRLAGADLTSTAGVRPDDDHLDNCGRITLLEGPRGWTLVSWLADAPGGLRSSFDATTG